MIKRNYKITCHVVVPEEMYQYMISCINSDTPCIRMQRNEQVEALQRGRTPLFVSKEEIKQLLSLLKEGN